MVEENRNKYHCIFPLWSIWPCPSKRAHISEVADLFDSSTNSQWCVCHAFKQKLLSTCKDAIKTFARHNYISTYLVSHMLVNRERLWTNDAFSFDYQYGYAFVQELIHLGSWNLHFEYKVQCSINIPLICQIHAKE